MQLCCTGDEIAGCVTDQPTAALCRDHSPVSVSAALPGAPGRRAVQRPHRADGAGQQHTCGSAGACAPGAHRRAGRAGSIGRARVRLGALPLTAGRSQAARTGTHVRWRSGLSWRRSFLIQHRVDGRGHSARTTPPPAPTDRRIRSAHRHCAVGLVCRRYLRRWNSHRRRRQRRKDRAEVESGTDTFSD